MWWWNWELFFIALGVSLGASVLASLFTILMTLEKRS